MAERPKGDEMEYLGWIDAAYAIGAVGFPILAGLWAIGLVCEVTR
jgi:hypothetical protein